MTMPMDIHPSYITNKKNEKISVILSIDEFEDLLEDIEDLAIMAQRKDEDTISHDKVLEELKLDKTI